MRDFFPIYRVCQRKPAGERQHIAWVAGEQPGCAAPAGRSHPGSESRELFPPPIETEGRV